MNLELYDIRLCKKEEYNKLVDFFKEHWSSRHIFCTCKEIFEFQHGNADNGYYDFVLAIHRETGEIHSVLGFIRSSLYDGTSFDNPHTIYGALWKTRDDIVNAEVKRLGLFVLYYLIQLFPNSTYISLGLSDYSQRIYKGLHFQLGIMNHYYIANPSKSDYSIISNPVITNGLSSDNSITIAETNKYIPVENHFIPTKNESYITNRYLRHPFYKYKLICIYKNNIPVSEWVVRKITVGNSSCIRIVDMIGSLENIGNISPQINQYLNSEDAEYIDCYNIGIDKDTFLNLGFIERAEDTEVIVPNYFEPFLQENVEIHYTISSDQTVVIFKGDGDQDRPSVITSESINNL